MRYVIINNTLLITLRLPSGSPRSCPRNPGEFNQVVYLIPGPPRNVCTKFWLSFLLTIISAPDRPMSTPQQGRKVSSVQRAQYFRFKEFPVEISTPILAFSTVSTLWRWRTYRSLVVVSRTMQALAYDACLPHLPVMLHTRQHVNTFSNLLEHNPTTVGSRIRTLWFIAGIKAGVERTLGGNILQRCTRITHRLQYQPPYINCSYATRSISCTTI